MATDNRPIDHAGRTIDFGRTVADYERHRPGFPDQFFSLLVDRGWVTSGQRVLDLGTGTGSVAFGLADVGLDVTGLDISSELLDGARRTAKNRCLEVRFVEGTAESTGQDDASFDVVTAGQCWWWFDSDRAAREVTRVLRPGGRLVICDFSYLPLEGNVSERTEQLILQHNPGWTKAGGTRIHPEQVTALDRGGYESVESFSYLVDITFTHEAWRGRVRTCNGVGSALSDVEVEYFDGQLRQLLEDEFPAKLVIPHRIFVTSGVTASQ
ncbi:MAG: class I SAM-dependent methyltransferase [Acidimicrobiia bacterium]